MIDPPAIQAAPTPAAGMPQSNGWGILALLIAFTGLGFVQKFTGLAGCLLYLAAVLAFCYAVRKSHHLWAGTCGSHFKLLAGVMFAGLVVCFAVVYPMEDSKGPGKSSDRDEGLNLAATRMMEGSSPYYPATPEAGPLSVLPGSIILASPFVAIGNSAYQNFFWLAVFLGAAVWFFKDKALALALLAVPLAASPAMQYEFISGGDLIANGIFVAVFALAALTAWSNPDAPAWSRWLACLLLGVGLASRANFILLAPLFGAVVWQISGPRNALIATSLVGLVILIITVPFYLHDPAGFTPFLSRHKLSSADSALPWAGKAMIGATVLASLLCAAWLMRKRTVSPIIGFFRGCTLVTLTPMLCTILTTTWIGGHADFSFLRDRFGLMFVFFALFGWGGQWLEGARSVPRARTAM